MWLTVLVSLWTALLGEGQVVKGTTLADMMTFVIVNMIVQSLIRNNIGFMLAQRFEDGSIAIDFIRPIRLKYYLLAEQLGDSMYRTLLYIVPIGVAATLFLDFTTPDSGWQYALFAISLILGFLLICQINFIVGLLVFWLKSPIYTNWFLGAFMELFAGTVVPLWFYPTVLYNISMALPFRFISYEPVSIFIGRTSLHDAWLVIVMQLVWLAVFLVLEAFIWNRVQRKVIVQGG